MVLDLPELPLPLQAEYEACRLRLKQVAERLREERFGRFVASSSSRPAFTPMHNAVAADPSKPVRQRQTDYIVLPLQKAAIVIGHNGEGLKRIEKMAQVRLQVDHTYTTAQSERRLVVTGFAEDVAEARRIVEEGAFAAGQASAVVMVPNSRVGLVIGRGGETIRELQERSGAKIMVAPDLAGAASHGHASERIVTIIGEPPAVQKAKALIDDVVFGRGTDGGGGVGGGKEALPPGFQEVVIEVPEACVGAIIGRKAENLRAMQAISGCRVHVDPHASTTGQGGRRVTLCGVPEAIAYAKSLLQDKIATIDSAFGGGYGYDVAGGGVVYQAAGDFSGLSADTADAMLLESMVYYQQPQ